MGKKQTAVEWLVEQYTQGNYSWEVYDKAKEMEKQQIKQAYNDGKAAVIHIENNMSLEEYFNETYKNETK